LWLVLSSCFGSSSGAYTADINSSFEHCLEAAIQAFETALAGFSTEPATAKRSDTGEAIAISYAFAFEMQKVGKQVSP